jgi:hypothetical protein
MAAGTLAVAAAPLRFTFDRRPLEGHERRVFEADLDALDLDTRVLDVLDGLVSTGTRDDIPHVLRGYRGHALVLAAHPIVSRRTMQSMLPSRLGALLDTVPSPVITWTRHDPGVDLCGSPGFVAEGEDREALVREAIMFLCRRFASVTLLEDQAVKRPGPCVELRMPDSGRYVGGRRDIDRLFATRTHLKRKMAKFRNKGGTIDVVEGPLTPDDRAGVLHCIGCAQAARVITAPYQGNYTNMVDWATTATVPGLVHLIARLDGVLVGYHAFVESGRQLLCLSGAFDRTRHSTYHAYENLLVEAMRYAEARGLARVCFGPVTNTSKAAVMTDAMPLVARLYSRWAAMRGFMRWLVPRSAFRPGVFAPYQGLGLPPAS